MFGSVLPLALGISLVTAIEPKLMLYGRISVVGLPPLIAGSRILRVEQGVLQRRGSSGRSATRGAVVVVGREHHHPDVVVGVVVPHVVEHRVHAGLELPALGLVAGARQPVAGDRLAEEVHHRQRAEPEVQPRPVRAVGVRACRASADGQVVLGPVHGVEVAR